MDYVTIPNLKAPMLSDKYIGFTLDELDLAGDIIIKALEKENAKAKKKYEKYLGLVEIGEATEKQQTIFWEAEERYRGLDYMVNKFKELRAFTSTIKLR